MKTPLSNGGTVLTLQAKDHRLTRPLFHSRKPLLAFTLIELLVVIAIISLLAAMVFPIVGAVNRSKIRTRARGELLAVETAIEAYKAKFGVYPPMDTNSVILTPLYYELQGTKYNDQTRVYTTISGTAQISETAINSSPYIFGRSIGGFFNCARSGGDEKQGGINFLHGGLKASQFLELTTNSVTVCILGAAVDGPVVLRNARAERINPWRYNSANPTNNPGSFDLWIDVTVSGKTNRICNWSREPLIVN